MSSIELFHPPVQQWFRENFPAPSKPQELGWPLIEKGHHTLIFAPTGSGKTLAAFLWGIDHILCTPAPKKSERCRLLYISPLKALATDVEKNLRSPLSGITAICDPEEIVSPVVTIRT